MQLSWTVDSENGLFYADIELTGKKAWVGFGLHRLNSKDSGMTNADFIVATFETGQVFFLMWMF
jgi:hypothetical protein